MKILFIVNPAAGHGRGRRRWESASARILSSHPGSAARLTSGPGEAAGICRRALAEGFEAVVAVGGDGTLSETLQGYLGAEETLRRNAALGTWPVGSGCDLARHFGLKGGVEEMSALLARPRIRRLDAGQVEFQGLPGRESRFFINVAALGLAGDVARRVHRGGKPLGGPLSYLMSSLACLWEAKPRALELVVDGERQPAARYHLVALANTSTTGGGMRIAPRADAEDGKFDMVAVGDLSRRELLRRFPLIYTGGHIGSSGVSHRLVRKLEVRSDETVYLNMDGEAVGTAPAVFQILPASVPFLCPT